MAGRVTFNLSADDYLAANRDWFAKTVRQPRTLVRIAILVVFCACAGLVINWLERGGALEAVVSGGGFALLGLVTALLCYLAGYLALPLRTRRIYRQQKNLGEQWSYSWSDEGLEFTSPTSTSRIAWPDMWRWSMGPRAFLFLVNEQGFFPVPFRVLSDEQAADLRALASAHGPPRL
jgi:hypothetical protein